MGGWYELGRTRRYDGAFGDERRATRLAPARAIVALALSRGFDADADVVRGVASLFDAGGDAAVTAVAGGVSSDGGAGRGSVSRARA